MNKKFWTMISLVLVAVMLLAACAQPAAPTTAPEPTEAPAMTEEVQPTEAPAATEEPAAEAKVITVWGNWEGAYLDAIKAALDDYAAAHPGITIEVTKPDDIKNALNVAIPGGEGPDLVEGANDWIGEQALAGNIVDLDQFGVTQDFLSSTYEPAAVKGVVWQDKIWALPETQEGIALLYNKDLVTDEYLPTDPKDFADLLAKVEKFQTDKGMPLICNQGLGSAGKDPYHAAPIYFGFGVPEYVDDQGNAFANTPEAIAAGEWIASFGQTTSLKDADDKICPALFAEGKVGMFWTGPWQIKATEDAGINYGILPMGSPFVGIRTMLMSKNAVDRGNQDVTLDLMKYMTSAEVQKQLALVNKTIPAQTAAVNDPEVQAIPALAGFGAALNLGVPMANTPFASAQWGPMGDATNAIFNGTQSPTDALNAAQTAIEEAIAGMQ